MGAYYPDFTVCTKRRNGWLSLRLSVIVCLCVYTYHVCVTKQILKQDSIVFLKTVNKRYVF